jgi:hypothetical protein
MNLHLCPVCGYDLWFAPWVGDSAADEICPSCGIQFGYDDAAGGDPAARPAVYAEWRAAWIAKGMPWDKGYSEPPPDWNPLKQLQRIGITL